MGLIEVPNNGDSLKETINRYLIVLAGFLLNGQVFGHNYATCFLYTALLRLNPDKEIHISLIGSITFGLVFLSGIFMIILMKHVPERYILCIGLLLFSIAPIVSAFVEDVRLWYITYAVPRGVGGSILYLLSYSSAAKAFPNNMCVASTVVSQGASVFSILTPLMAEMLLTRYGLFRFLIIDGAYMWLFVICIPLFCSSLQNDKMCGKESINLNKNNEIELKIIEDNRSQEECQPLQSSSVNIWNSECKFISHQNENWMKVFKQKNFIIFLVVSIIFFSFGNIPYVHSDNYLTGLSLKFRNSTSIVMTIVGLSAIISKIVAAILVQVCKCSVILLLQIALLMFGIGLSLFGCLAYIGSQKDQFYTSILYLGSMSLGMGEGCVWSLIYTSCYTCANPFTSAYIFCIYSCIISVPCSVGAPFASFMYTQIGSYPMAYFIGGTAYIITGNLLWLIDSNNNFINRTTTTQTIKVDGEAKNGQANGIES